MSNYLETATGITNSLALLAKELTLSKFIRWIFAILIIFAIALYGFDKYSSTFYYNKLDRKLLIIDQIQKLSQNDSLIQKETHKKIMEVLVALDPPNEMNGITPKAIQNALIKLLGAILFPVFAIYSSWNKYDRRNIIVGAMAFIIIFGSISIFIPTIYSLWVNFFLLPIIEILILMPFIQKK